MTDNTNAVFEDIDQKNLIPYKVPLSENSPLISKKDGIMFENSKIKDAVDDFNQIKCPISKCNDTTVYHSIANLKKHLKERHNRFFW